MEQSTIRLLLESEAFDIESGGLFVFPAQPPKELIDQIRKGEFQVVPVPIVGNLADKVPIQGAGQYSGGLTNVTLRSKRGQHEWVATQVALPTFSIGQQEIDRGEGRVLLPAVANLKVMVVDNQDHPVSGAKVCVMEPGRSMCAETDASGAFTFQLALGEYPVVVTGGERRQATLLTCFEEVSVVLRQPGRSCRVMVVDGQGRPYSGCTRVRGVNESEAPGERMPASAGWLAGLEKGTFFGSSCQDGSVLFTGLAAGVYRFELHDQPSNSVSVTIDSFEPRTVTLVSG